MTRPATTAQLRAESRARRVSEHAEQAQLVAWARAHVGRHPELALLHAVPNGGARSKAAAGKLKAEGVLPGIPDLCLPVARGGWHGLYIELKTADGGRVSPEQRAMHAALTAQGYAVHVCRGFEAARQLLGDYLAGAVAR